MMQMMNAEINYNGVVNGGVAIPVFKQGNGGIGLSSCNKQPPGAAKKTALRDVQNQSSGLAQNHQENSSFLAGGADADGVRVCGNKRLTPECPSVQATATIAARNSSKTNSIEGTHHQQMMERYIHLQKLLKECDESNCRNYIQLLQHLSPAELSRHAFEVEARATQLEMEEGLELIDLIFIGLDFCCGTIYVLSIMHNGKEIHEMKALNVLGKSTLTGSSLQTTLTLASIHCNLVEE